MHGRIIGLGKSDEGAPLAERNYAYRANFSERDKYKYYMANDEQCLYVHSYIQFKFQKACNTVV